MIVKGCETPGFVIVAMAKARIWSCAHNPVWWHHQLKSKDTWVGSVECMQVCYTGNLTFTGAKTVSKNMTSY